MNLTTNASVYLAVEYYADHKVADNRKLVALTSSVYTGFLSNTHPHTVHNINNCTHVITQQTIGRCTVRQRPPVNSHTSAQHKTTRSALQHDLTLTGPTGDPPPTNTTQHPHQHNLQHANKLAKSDTERQPPLDLYEPRPH